MTSPTQASGSAPDRGRSAITRRLRRWRWLILALVIVVVGAIARPGTHLLRMLLTDVDGRSVIPPGHVDDASRLNQTRVAGIIDVSPDMATAERQLAELLARARREHQTISVAGRRHSMGGQTFVPDGLTVNMLPLCAMTLDADNSRLHVEAGAVWADIIRHLDTRGYSVAVMQSNNSFSVGGSLSVNCHGWQYGQPPIASTVESFRLMKADGEIVRCSRKENVELFSLVLGGYGLFGILLDVELRVVPNQRYRLERFVIRSDEAFATFDDKIASRADAAMVYGRMNVSDKRFLDDVILCAFVEDPAADGSIPKLSDPGLTSLRRAVFRGSADSDYGKEFRWTAETKLQTHIAATHYSRNQLLNDSVEVFQNRSADTTDILHEYFLPRDGVEDFVVAMRRIIPAHHGNLLNVTVRAVEEDRDSFLRFADQRMLALVMLFQQPRSTAGDDAMQAMTRDLIDAALSGGGRYYLPYRLHATPEQFRAAYPQAAEFFRLKRHYDPDELFQNQFYRRYGQETSGDVGTQAN